MKKKITYAAFFIIIIIVGIGVYYLILPPRAPPPVIPENPPRIVGHTAYLDKVDQHITFFTVVGVVQNNLGINIEAVNVTATFYDETNYEIGVRYSPIVMEILKPEQRSPFAIYLLVDSSTALSNIHYELTLEYRRTNKESITGLVILNQNSSIDQQGYHKISGEIQNKGLREAFTVSLFCMYYDEENNFLTMTRAYVDSEMEIGEKQSFELSSNPQKISPARYELLVVPHHYGLLLVTHLTLLLFLGIIFVLVIVYMRRRGW